MLTNPELVNYFAAMKIALRLKASMHMNVNTHSEYEICFSIPMSSKPPE
jgi:hypothetical protein